MPIYAEYAQVYDASGQLEFSLRMIAYLRQVLARHPAPGLRMADLACGTGTVAIAMARAGWHVTGIDFSEAMLAEARTKARRQRARVTWLHQDMRRFTLRDPVHLVTCLYDSLNYMLTSDDLAAVFGRVREALVPKGLFIFDMNTVAALTTFWNDETYFTDTGDLAVAMESKYDDRQQRVRVVVTCFQKVGNDLYRKIKEEHWEQAYPDEQIATLLVDAGFSIEGRYQCFSFLPPTAETPRILWVARARTSR